MSILLKGGTVVSSHDHRRLDVRINGEHIVELGANLPVNDSIVEDVSGCYLLPGFIDAHTHLQLNNGAGAMNNSDNFSSGSAAAVAKGTTTVIDMATPDKGKSLQECLDTWIGFSNKRSSCDFTYHMSIIEWNDNIKREIKSMFEQGIPSFKVYLAYDNLRISDADLYEIMLEIKKYHGMLGCHCENGDMVDELREQFVKEGKLTPHYHPLSRPDTVESEAVNRYLMIASYADFPVNIVHLSTKSSLDTVRRARQNGQKVFVETCPHYLTLDDHVYDYPKFESAKYVCSPPMRKETDVEALWEGVELGEVTTISTDHCAFNFEGQKTVGKDNFTKIPNGMPGVETRPEVIYTAGVSTGRITLEEMVALLSENTARQFGMFPQKGIIQENSDADIVIWDPEVEGVISSDSLLTECDYTPFEGFATKGAPRSVFLRGLKVAENGKVIEGNKGRFVSRHECDYNI